MITRTLFHVTPSVDEMDRGVILWAKDREMAKRRAKAHLKGDPDNYMVGPILAVLKGNQPLFVADDGEEYS